MKTPHTAITHRVKPGREFAYEERNRRAYQRLRTEFIQAAFNGAVAPVPTPGDEHDTSRVWRVVERMVADPELIGWHLGQRMLQLVVGCAESHEPANRLSATALLYALAHRYAEVYAPAYAALDPDAPNPNPEGKTHDGRQQPQQPVTEGASG